MGRANLERLDRALAVANGKLSLDCDHRHQPFPFQSERLGRCPEGFVLTLAGTRRQRAQPMKRSTPRATPETKRQPKNQAKFRGKIGRAGLWRIRYSSSAADRKRTEIGRSLCVKMERCAPLRPAARIAAPMSGASEISAPLDHHSTESLKGQAFDRLSHPRRAPRRSCRSRPRRGHELLLRNP